MENKILDLDQTPIMYQSYVKSKRVIKRAKFPLKLLGFLLAIGGFTYAYSNAHEAFDYSKDINNLTGITSTLDENDPNYNVYNMQLESYKTMKNLSIVNAVASSLVAITSLGLIEFILSAIKKEKDKNKQKFYAKFCDEVFFIKSDLDYMNLDYILHIFLLEVAQNEQISIEELQERIFKKYPFPKYEEQRYQDIFVFIEDYLNTHNYKEQNEIIYNALPKAFISFSAFLDRKGIALEKFNNLNRESKTELFEAFISEQYKKYNNEKEPIQVSEKE